MPTSPTTDFSQMSATQFYEQMVAQNLLRGYIVHPKAAASRTLPESLLQVVDGVHANPGYANHEAVFFQVDVPTKCLFFVFVHDTTRGMAQGGTRMLAYPTIGDMLYDGLRLSRAMTEKNSVAGLWWGGGKAIICPIDGMDNINPARRKSIFERYGAFVASLNGVFVAAEDMNTTPEDMQVILTQNRFVTCLPPAVGGSSNPSPWTAKGVFQAMRAAAKHYHQKDALTGMSVLIQGVGNVGKYIAQLLHEDGAHLLIADTNPKALAAVQAFAPDAEIVPLDAVYTTSCDIFAPCARGGGVNKNTIPNLKCQHIIGAANNQLEDDERDTELLKARNITYLPDFFINRMGIINCANEQYGYLEEDLNKAVQKIFQDVLWLLKASEDNSAAPYKLAIDQARVLTAIEHPIWGHRGIKIIGDLLGHWSYVL